MRTIGWMALATALAACTTSAPRMNAAAGPVAWDPPQVESVFEAARQALARGDAPAAERLCYQAFEAIDDAVPVGYDAYAALLESDRSGEAATMRERARQLRALREARRSATQPTSNYLGFSPAQDLDAYAALLQARQRTDESRRMRALAAAYTREQGAHVQRTLLYQARKDPRGTC